MKTRTKVLMILVAGLGLILLIGKLYNEDEYRIEKDIQIVEPSTSESSTTETTTTTTTITTKKAVKTTKKKQVEFRKVATASKQEYINYAKAYSGYNDTQMQCLDYLWEHESSWNPNNINEKGACGIPQSLPCNKIYKQQGSYDWQSQIRWGINYINYKYKNPCSAWNHFKNHRMY